MFAPFSAPLDDHVSDGHAHLNTHLKLAAVRCSTYGTLTLVSRDAFYPTHVYPPNPHFETSSWLLKGGCLITDTRRYCLVFYRYSALRGNFLCLNYPCMCTKKEMQYMVLCC